jgi:hypothetical protein
MNINKTSLIVPIIILLGAIPSAFAQQQYINYTVYYTEPDYYTDYTVSLVSRT